MYYLFFFFKNKIFHSDQLLFRCRYVIITLSTSILLCSCDIVVGLKFCEQKKKK